MRVKSELEILNKYIRNKSDYSHIEVLKMNAAIHNIISDQKEQMYDYYKVFIDKSKL